MMLRKQPASPTASRQLTMREEWMNEIKQIKQLLENNERLFNMTNDFDVTDYTIHERNALNTRYRYLLRCIRECDAQSTQPAQFPVRL